MPQSTFYVSFVPNSINVMCVIIHLRLLGAKGTSSKLRGPALICITYATFVPKCYLAVSEAVTEQKSFEA